MPRSTLLLILTASIPFLTACQPEPQPPVLPSFAKHTTPDEFADYWFQGKAELTSYDLNIVQYGEERKGDALMIFVTEGISPSKQVKLDHPKVEGEDMLTVMKLNRIWRFNTGIYDYSLMGSIFTPIQIEQYPYSLKESISLQDWCGQSFHQLNREKDDYLVRQFSYFEKEGDQSFKIHTDLLEDELFTRLRINPGSVPVGEYDLVPSGFFLRLSHEPIKPKRARIQFQESEASIQCVVEYLHLDRTVSINFEPEFPHKILSWTEKQGQNIVVEGKVRQTIRNDYWTKNAGEFLPLRDSLKIAF